MAQLKSVRTYIQDTRNRVFEIHCSQHALQSSRLIKWLNKPVKNQFCLLLGIIITVGDRCEKKKTEKRIGISQNLHLKTCDILCSKINCMIALSLQVLCNSTLLNCT